MLGGTHEGADLFRIGIYSDLVSFTRFAGKAKHGALFVLREVGGSAANFHRANRRGARCAVMFRIVSAPSLPQLPSASHT